MIRFRLLSPSVDQSIDTIWQHRQAGRQAYAPGEVAPDEAAAARDEDLLARDEGSRAHGSVGLGVFVVGVWLCLHVRGLSFSGWTTRRRVGVDSNDVGRHHGRRLLGCWCFQTAWSENNVI